MGIGVCGVCVVVVVFEVEACARTCAAPNPSRPIAITPVTARVPITRAPVVFHPAVFHAIIFNRNISLRISSSILLPHFLQLPRYNVQPTSALPVAAYLSVGCTCATIVGGRSAHSAGCMGEQVWANYLHQHISSSLPWLFWFCSAARSCPNSARVSVKVSAASKKA